MPKKKSTKRSAVDRRKRAAEREADRGARTPKQQLKRLDDLLGVGVGAKRERARLLEQRKQERAA